jgi:TetR/AcrR family transcriptional regulator, transcriptional repressor for nem operon
MKKSKVETAETRKRIIEVASRQFRRNGINATGLSEVMSEAGLTHGGFYRHFDSKNQLVAEACEAGMSAMVDALGAPTSEGDSKNPFESIVDIYVSERHRDNAEGGCPLAGTGSELARADLQTREAAARGINHMVDLMAKGMQDRPADVAHSDAVFALAAMVGAVTMSRIIENPDVSASVLAIVKEHLNAL